MTKAILLLLTAILVQPLMATETFVVTPEKSDFKFKIMNKPPKATEFSEVLGAFNEFSGTVTFDADNPEKSAIVLEIKAASIDTANEKRDEHLRNADFFKVKEFPTMSFKSTGVKKLDGGNYEVTGDFTMLGKTKPVTTVFEKTGENAGKTSFQIKRSDYGMTYRIPDTADEVEVMLTLVGIPE